MRDPNRSVSKALTTRQNELATSHPERFRAAMAACHRAAKRHASPDDTGALAALMVAGFLPRGTEHQEKAWNGAVKRAVARAAALMAEATEKTEPLDLSTLADDTRTSFGSAPAPSPDRCADFQPVDYAAGALLRLPDSHREPMRLAAQAMRRGDQDGLTYEGQSGSAQRKIREARTFLSGHRHAVLTNPCHDAALTPTARVTRWAAHTAAMAAVQARAGQNRHEWTPGTYTGHRTMGPVPLGGLATTATRARITPDGPTVTIPPERIAAALTRWATTRDAMTPDHLTRQSQHHALREAHLMAADHEAQQPYAGHVAAWHRHHADRAATAVQINRATMPGTADGSRAAKEPTAQEGRLAALTLPTTVTTRPVTGWTPARTIPTPEPTGLRARALLMAARMAAAETGEPLPDEARPAQVAAWQTPGGSARVRIAPTVTERRIMDTGVPGTEYAAVTVTLPNGQVWLSATLPNPHKATQREHSAISGPERRALDDALSIERAPVTTAPDMPTALDSLPPVRVGRFYSHDADALHREAARADRAAGAKREGTPRKPSTRKRKGDATGPTVPAWF